MPDERAPTHDETMRVRRQECRIHGHSWGEVRTLGEELPHLFVCSNCGRTLRVVAD